MKGAENQITLLKLLITKFFMSDVADKQEIR